MSRKPPNESHLGCESGQKGIDLPAATGLSAQGIGAGQVHPWEIEE
jgi:hypothetical protein